MSMWTVQCQERPNDALTQWKLFLNAIFARNLHGKKYVRRRHSQKDILKIIRCQSDKATTDTVISVWLDTRHHQRHQHLHKSFNVFDSSSSNEDGVSFLVKQNPFPTRNYSFSIIILIRTIQHINSNRLYEGDDERKKNIFYFGSARVGRQSNITPKRLIVIVLHFINCHSESFESD